MAQSKNNVSQKSRGRRKQPRKDSRDKRVNYDNTRVTKFDEDVSKSRRSGDNDVSWYTRSKQLLDAAASVSFYNTVGAKPTIGQTASTAYATQDSVPGIMVLRWAPNLSGSDSRVLNQAANSKYSYVVHANSRNYAYDPADLMMLILGGINCYAAIAIGIRAYGTMKRYNGLDYYTPDALVQAQGFDPDDLRKNLSNMWFDLNDLIASMRQIWIPDDMPITKRWFWMSSNIYRDAKSAKSQYYMYVPMGLYQYDATLSEEGGGLEYINWGGNSSPQTWSQYLSMVRGMIQALLDSQDRGIIYGDILKAYGAERIFTLSEIDANYAIEPEYNQEVLTQFENASILGMIPGNIYQTAEGTIQQYWRANELAQVNNILNFASSAKTRVLNFHQVENPTPEQVIVATRMMTAGLRVKQDAVQTTLYNVEPVTAGTEVIYDAQMYFYTYNNTENTVTLRTTQITDQNGSFNFFVWSQWATFDWAPWLYQCKATAVTGPVNNVTSVVTYAVGDYDNYTYIQQSELQKMHDSALYSLLGVPTIL